MYATFQALAQAYPALSILCAMGAAALFATITSKWL